MNMIGGSTKIIKKYQKKREREDRANQGIKLNPTVVVPSSGIARIRA
jgi:hypothetical protein